MIDVHERVQDAVGRCVRWDGGPTANEVITLAESRAWPVDVPVTLSLRRRPERDPRKPVLHTVSTTINEWQERSTNAAAL